MYVHMKPDNYVSANILTLVANTNKAVDIPANCNGFHAYPQNGAPVYFKKDGVASIPNGTDFVAEGFLAPGQDNARLLSNEAIGTGHTLNLMSTGAGTVVLEFFVHG